MVLAYRFRKIAGAFKPQRNLLLGALLLAPTALLAVGGEGVSLQFTANDKLFLWISLALAVIAIVTGFLIRSWVQKQPGGSEKMQEVSAAIKQGALAYLRRQFKTMGIFVVVLAVGLYLLYRQDYEGIKVLGIDASIWLAICFVLGVLASYIAGYVGMMMAVSANARVANAALSSYKSALEIAFRSGAVAGLITVGMGLLGATLIFLVAGGEAMRLLIGFGFGGSLAALFMRVGGGIYTKAADVGADLVGKVEAGIPEDDPRNAATIADNVGDNVGDCAGMAADVFESYEVTLVAAIVLGAATAAVFDQSTWMKLVLFALMARGVGIVASILGVFMVRGKDDENLDPLKPIRSGFRSSAIIASVGTLGLAFLMMQDINTTYYVDADNKTHGGIRVIPFEEIKALGAMADVRDQLEAAATDKDKDEFAALSHEDLTDKVNEHIDTIYKQDLQTYEANKQFLPPNTPAPKKPTPVDEELVKKLRTSPLLNYTFVMGTSAAGNVMQAFSRGLAEGIFLTQTEMEAPPDTTGQTPQPPKKQIQWQVYSKMQLDQLESGGQLKVLGRHEIQLGADTRGEMFWLVGTSDVKVTTVSNKDAATKALAEGLGIDTAKASSMLAKLPATVFSGATANTAANLRDKLSAAGATVAIERTNLGEGFKEKGLVSMGSIEYTKSRVKMPEPGGEQPVVRPDGKWLTVAGETNVVEWWRFFIAIFFGIIMAFGIEGLTDYFVSFEKKPVREVAAASSAGPAPMIIQGMAYGMESSVWSVIAIVVSLLAPLFIFPSGEYGGYLLSFYGIALVGLGLLTTTGYILAMDTFGPISDNAQGVYEMSKAGHGEQKEAGKMSGTRAVQLLDAAGNTTKALTKGFAIATAVVAAVALFHSFIESAKLTDVGLRLELPQIFIGMMVGGAAPFLFSAFSINAVGRASFKLIGEVRRQFAADPGIMAGTSKPDYARCVAIVTQAAQQELLGPGILAIAFPALVAFGLSIGQEPTVIGGVSYNLVGAQALGGFLAGAILSGQLLAVTLANAGGLWDNAKKRIEDGHHGGKGSDAHKAGVVCDTVGDPFKDTAGPALNPLIKVMNLVAVLLVPIVIRDLGDGVLITISVVCIVALAIAAYWSKRGSLGTELQKSAGAAD
ncbi:MAG: putative K(+)-stimulated pyrophosphate-energized sodium pump [Fimbriimonadales bacterium]|nr:putative K(+)-stimulated pyrophosphate-energized sodium pump [Fimbriimonadales bacterium]